MRKLKVYLDTSVISYLYQNDTPEKMNDTLLLWEMFRQERYEVFISDIVLNEIGNCQEENFKHIVNVKTVRGVKTITTLEGYKDLMIYPPSVLLEGDEEE